MRADQIVDVPLVSSACRGTNVLVTDCLDSAGEPVCQLMLLRKEVIQPQVPLRLPCYDFIPVTAHTVGHHWCTSGANDSHDVTGGVYKARERIHAVVADTALLAIPASRRRVAACDPNWAQF